jgi:hypothetical protein
MYAKITKDHLFDPNDRYSLKIISREGWVLWSENFTPAVILIECKLYDDDGELYYEAYADDEALEPLFNWAQIDAGVTLLKIKNKDGEWEDCIG